MDDVSSLSSGICLKSRFNTQTRQFWDDDSDFWQDEKTLRAIEELDIAEKAPADAAQREKSKVVSPPSTNPPRDNGKKSGGEPTSSSSSKPVTATVFRPSQPLRSQGIHASCQEVT